MALDITRVRNDTPACERLIHFNNAGCALMPEPVQRQVFDYLHQEQRDGGYETANQWADELNGLYASIAKMINCDPIEVAFSESNSRAWQQFFYSLKLNRGDKIITTRMDYGSNMVAYIQAGKNKGCEIQFIETDSNGDLDLEHLEQLIDQKTQLISISHIPTGCGIVNDAEKIGDLASAHGIPFLLDACQSIGQLDLDVKKLKCTGLTATGRKYLRGPRGTGFLYVSKDWFRSVEPHYLEQQSVNLIDDSNYNIVESAKRFENFEGHFGGKVGLKAAVDYALALGLSNIEDRVFGLAESCRNELLTIPGVSIHDLGKRQCGIVTFSISRQSPATTRERLSSKGINIWVSSGPGSLIDFQSRGIDSVARASLHYYNTDQEIEKFCEVVKSII